MFPWRSEIIHIISSLQQFKRCKVFACGVGYQFRADLIHYAPLKRENNCTMFLLSVIDVFSQYAMLFPLKNKQGNSVHDGLERIFDHMGTPIKLQMDRGKEFYNQHVGRFLREKTVHHFSMEQDAKAQIVDPFNMTVWEIIKWYMTHMNSLWYICHRHWVGK